MPIKFMYRMHTCGNCTAFKMCWITPLGMHSSMGDNIALYLSLCADCMDDVRDQFPGANKRLLMHEQD